MANDFKKAEPTKNEKMFYEIMVRQESLGRDLWTVSTNVLALSILLKVDPKKVAELLVDEKQVKEYADKINVAIREIEDAKKPPEAPEHKHDHTDHSEHDHNGHNHKHD